MDQATAARRVSTSTEVQLVAASQAGDRDAFDALIQPRLARIVRLALSIVRNESDARDAVQEACLHAWTELPRLRDPDRFEAWLWRIVINRCRTTIRTRNRRAVREVAVDQLPPSVEVTDTKRPIGEELTTLDALRRAIGRLDADRRALLVLHHVEHRPVVEIAELLGIPEGTAKWRLYAARQALEKAIAEEDR